VKRMLNLRAFNFGKRIQLLNGFSVLRRPSKISVAEVISNYSLNKYTVCAFIPKLEC
jgi:hypothetical protein